MTNYDNSYLEKITEILEDCKGKYINFFGPVIVTIMGPRKEAEPLVNCLKEHAEIIMPDALKSLLDFPIKKFRYKILRNLSSFTRDSQEKNYVSMLIDFIFEVGVNIGELSFYEQTIPDVEKLLIDTEICRAQ